MLVNTRKDLAQRRWWRKGVEQLFIFVSCFAPLREIVFLFPLFETYLLPCIFNFSFFIPLRDMLALSFPL